MFHGSIVALITPFTDDGGIDFQALERLVSFHVREGTDALVIAGTTGESATLEKDEYTQLVAEAVRLAGDRIPVIAGTGSSSTAHSVALSQKAESLGVSAVLVVTPYYNRPTQAGLEQHFTAIADAVSIPVILYNVPSRTSVDLAPQTAATLSRHPRIVGFKEAVADPDRIKFLVAACGPAFVILSGDDPSCLQAMRAGARGVVSVAANIAPRQMHDLCEAASVGDWGRAEGIDSRLAPLYETLALETNPIPVKWATFEMGLTGPGLRMPLTPLDARHRGAVRECLDQLQISRMDDETEY
ncbi:MAG: 4-hydroxy-tetrahydrodipicolinate synthase [Xanthomonadales bacterium]|nr:4-hydroxy-tetrahydrodipicolinate synthase [Xanthomonadales bacterium]